MNRRGYVKVKQTGLRAWGWFSTDALSIRVVYLGGRVAWCVLGGGWYARVSAADVAWRAARGVLEWLEGSRGAPCSAGCLSGSVLATNSGRTSRVFSNLPGLRPEEGHCSIPSACPAFPTLDVPVEDFAQYILTYFTMHTSGSTAVSAEACVKEWGTLMQTPESIRVKPSQPEAPGELPMNPQMKHTNHQTRYNAFRAI